MEKIESASQESNQTAINIKDVLEWTFSHKLLIFSSVIICVILGLLYAYKTSPTYLRSSTIMLRSDTQGNAQISELAAFADLGMMNTGLDVYNEVEAFRSPSLMMQVVERLKLNIKYTTENWLGRVTDLYKESPFTIEFKKRIESFDGEPVSSFTFDVSHTEGNKLIASNFTAGSNEIESDPIELKVGQETITPIGTLVASYTGIVPKDSTETITVSYNTIEQATKSFYSRFKANLADKFTTVIAFDFTDTSIKRAEDVLNTIIEVYNEEWKEYMGMSAQNTSKFITERLAVIEEELGEVDKNIEDFKSQNKMIDITAETAQITAESSKFKDKSFLANNQLSIAEYIKDNLSDQSKQFELLPANSGIESQNIESQIAEYNKMILDRKRLLNNSSESNPLIKNLNEQIKMMRLTIFQSIDNLINTLKIEVEKIAKEESHIDNQISSNPGKIRELVQIERQQKIKEQLYLYLLQKREENELSANLVVNNTRILKPAMGDSAPTSPNKGIILVVSFIIGLGIPYGFMVVSFLMNNTIRGREDAESTNIPIVGEIPFIGKVSASEKIKKLFGNKDEKLPEILVKAHNRNIINEAFRVVRTNLDFILNKDTETPVIMITSFHVGSGKSFASLNLAASIAIKGKRAVIIDLDIRKGTVSASIGKTTTGVVNYLNGQAEISDIITQNANGIENLSVITTGTLPPNPAELLLSSRLDDLISELQKQYDYIFIDCPPIGVVADTTIISRVATRTIFAMRVGLFNRNLLPELKRIYSENKFPNMCLLVNGGKSALGYGYKSYGYGSYGYGNKDTDD